MTDRELWCFVEKFRQLRTAGKQAKLVMESQSGCALINLEVRLNPDIHHHEQQHRPQQEQQHRPRHRHHAYVHQRAAGGGPARERRRAQRAQARHSAAQG